MTADAPKGLAAVLDKGDAPESEDGDESGDYEAGKTAAAEAAMAAFKSGDAEALAAALSDFVSMCE